ncbi:hypothetical protein [Alteromonas hispanica]|uniref:MotA/TolQ/ExbB proton channel domain-containing protein n=1 Tax=Alteromonas hispanica TaxID=315421 RepID=A0A6L9MQG2_9ALTE|nr:hypothetical protein [Alteromonas hispanica]NDW20406.1 hypothetical protein [Alteromonas hispanica]
MGNLIQSLQIDLITFLLLVGIFGLFFVGLSGQIIGYRRDKKELGELFTMAKQLTKEEVVSLSKFSGIAADWLKQHLMLTLSSEDVVAEKRDGRFLIKSNISQAFIRTPGFHGKSLPALLTSIGVAGTFLGITLGLSEFNFSGVEQGTASLLQSASQLLEGMKTAFYTSLAGLAGSAIIMLVMQFFHIRLNSKTSKVNRLLSQCLAEASSVEFLQKIAEREQDQQMLDAQLQSTRAMEAVGNQFGELLTTFKGLGDNLNGEYIASQISDSVDNTMKNSVVPILSEFKDEIQTLRQIKQDNHKELLSQIINAIKEELIEPVTQELNKTTEAVNASNEVTEKLNTNVGKVLTNMSTTVETINKFNQDTMQKLQDFAQSLASVLDGFKDDTKSAMNDITQKVHDVLKLSEEGMASQRSAFEQSASNAADAFSGMREQLEAALDNRAEKEKQLFFSMEERIENLLKQTSQSFEEQNETLKTTGSEASALMTSAREEFSEGMASQREAFEQSAEKASQAFKGMGEQLEEALVSRAATEKELFDATEKRIENLLEQTNQSFKEQNDVLRTTGEQASSLMHTARHELEQGLGDIDSKITNMSHTIQTELEAFRIEYQKNLTTFFEDQSNLLEDSLNKQTTGLVDAVNRFKQVFEEEYQTRHNLLQELTQQHENLQSSAKTIENLAQAIGLSKTATLSELQDIANTMGRHIGALKKDYEQASRVFREVTEGLPKAMEKYFTQANQSTEQFFNTFDEAAANIHNRLAQAADYLVSAKISEMETKQTEAV